jgi:hypothetical protein
MRWLRRTAIGAVCFLLVLALFLPLCAWSQEFRIVPKQDPAVPQGKVMALQGTVGQGGEKFILEGLGILQPVEVTLLSKVPDADLALQLCKFDWKKPERSGSTKGTGIQTFKIRTEGDLKIFVASAQGEQPYQLTVWVGDEMRPGMRPAFVPKEEYKKMKGGMGGGFGFGSPVLWVIAFLLAAILAVLIIFLKRGRK